MIVDPATLPVPLSLGSDHLLDPERCRPLVEEAVALGITLVDTAEEYGPEASELTIAATLHPYHGMHVATKGGSMYKRAAGVPPGGRPSALRQALEGSLQRLRVDSIWLYFLHDIDADVPLAESMGVIDEMRREGKVQHIGLCNASDEQLADTIATLPLAAYQDELSPVNRASLSRVAQTAEARIPFFAYTPVGKAADDPAVLAVAAELSWSTAQVCLAWVAAQSKNVVPITGTTSIAHLRDNVAAVTTPLPTSALQALAET